MRCPRDLGLARPEREVARREGVSIAAVPFVSLQHVPDLLKSATPTTPRQGIGTRLIFAHVGAQFEIQNRCLVQSTSITGYLIGDNLFIVYEQSVLIADSIISTSCALTWPMKRQNDHRIWA